jgi:hypothetical protein
MAKFFNPETRFASGKSDQEEGDYIEDLDQETQAAIAEGLAQSERGDGRSWETVREELQARFINK